MKKHILSCCFLVFCGSLLQSQGLRERIKDKTNYFEICEIANQYYKEQGAASNQMSSVDIKEKHFRRWEWLMKNKLGENGELVNHTQLNIKAYEQMKTDRILSQKSTLSDWSFIGPSELPTSPHTKHYIGNGRLDRIAFHPTNANIIYVGAPSGGLWKTTNGGTTWSSLDNYLPTAGVSGIAISAVNPNIIYVLTGSGDGNGSYSNPSPGVYKSMDGGDSWVFKSFNVSGSISGFQIVVHPTNDNIVHAATSDGIKYTLNGGTTWLTKYAGAKYTDVRYQAASPYRLFAAGDAATSVKYSDNSVQWFTTNFSGQTPVPGRKGIGTSADDPTIVYLFCGKNSNQRFDGFYKSSDSGLSFTQVVNTPNLFGRTSDDPSYGQSTYNLCITVSPTDYKKIIVGGAITWKSINEGMSWDTITDYPYKPPVPILSYVHPDIHDVEYNPLNGNLYAATDGGFYKSVDNGSNWTNITNGIATTQFFSIASAPSNPDLIIGGSQDNGSKVKTGSSLIWDHFGGADSYITAYDPNNTNTFYHVAHSTISKYINNVETNITPPKPDITTHAQIATHISDSDIFFVGTRSDTFCRSSNQGAPGSWSYSSVKSDLCIATSPTNGNRLYVSGGWFSTPEVSKSINGGFNWTSINSGLPSFAGTTFLPTDIAVSPVSEDWLVVGISGYQPGEKIYHSFTGGENGDWTNISSNLPNVPVHCVAYLQNGSILVGTELGVFLKDNNSANWVPFSNNLPATQISEMIVHEAQGLVTICTYGRGAWRSDLPSSDCDENIVFNASENIEGRKYFEANNTIETNSTTIYGGDGTQVFFQAGTKIDLKEGFRAVTNGNGTVKAYIGPCGTEIPSIKETESKHEK